MAEPRNLPVEHLELFLDSIKAGYPVTYVEGSKILAVDHPELGYVTVQLLDNVVTTEEETEDA